MNASIRIPLAERDRRDELHRERYNSVFAEIEAQERANYDEEFGVEYRKLHPYQPDGRRINELTLEQLKREIE